MTSQQQKQLLMLAQVATPPHIHVIQNPPIGIQRAISKTHVLCAKLTSINWGTQCDGIGCIMVMLAVKPTT